MYNVGIRRPRIEDSEELYQLFSTVIRDTFAREGLSEWHDDIENEMEAKKQYLKYDLDSNGESRYFLLAFDIKSNKIIGTIEYGQASELINICTNGALKGMFEIGTVFVLPDYQSRGIGTLLLNAMFLTLLGNGVQDFCLDSGYTNSQKIWERKFGKPDYLLKDYWSEGTDHMIWTRSTKDMTIIFK